MSGHWPILSSNYDHWNAEPAEDLGRLLRKDVTVAATDVGALAFYSELKVVDICGLNSKEIASLPKRREVHALWGVSRMDYCVDKEVDVIVPGFPHYNQNRLTDRKIRALTPLETKELFTHAVSFPLPDIAEKYVGVSIPHPTRDGYYLNFLALRERVDEIWAERPPGVTVGDCW